MQYGALYVHQEPDSDFLRCCEVILLTDSLK